MLGVGCLRDSADLYRRDDIGGDPEWVVCKTNLIRLNAIQRLGILEKFQIHRLGFFDCPVL